MRMNFITWNPHFYRQEKKGQYQWWVMTVFLKLYSLLLPSSQSWWMTSFCETSSLCLSSQWESCVLIMSPSVLGSHRVTISTSIALYAKPANTETMKIYWIELGLMRWHSRCRHCQSSLINWDQFLGLTVWKERTNCK